MDQKRKQEIIDFISTKMEEKQYPTDYQDRFIKLLKLQSDSCLEQLYNLWSIDLDRS